MQKKNWELDQRSCERNFARRRRRDEGERRSQKFLSKAAGAVGQFAQVRNEVSRFGITLETRHV